MMKTLIASMFAAVSLLHAGMFLQGNTTVGVSFGSGSVNYGGSRGDESYTVAGFSGSYFVIDDLSVGVAYRHWFGTPSIDEVTLPLTYHAPLASDIRPYVGIFVRRVFMGEDYADESVYGYRAGVTVELSRQSYFGIGWVEEHWDECSYREECTSGYPEAVIGVSF